MYIDKQRMLNDVNKHNKDQQTFLVFLQLGTVHLI
jgi:hypothetical protein